MFLLRIITLLVFATVVRDKPAEPQAHVQGIVEDRYQARFLDPNTVTITCVSKQSCGERKETKQLSSAGEFSFELPAGTYEITASIWPMYPYKRAPLHLSSGQDLELRINPRIRMRSVALMADGSDKFDIAPKPQYESIELQPGSSALIEFESRRGSKKKSYNEGVISFESCSVTADRLVIDPSKKTISAKGRVIVTHGNKLEKFEQVELPFSSLLK